MQMQKLNIAELALNETENIKRQMAQNENVFTYSNSTHHAKNITGTNNKKIYSARFESQLFNNLSFSFCCKTDAQLSDESYKILIILNDVVIKDFDANSNSAHYFQVNFSAHQENQLSVVVECNNQVVFYNFETELSGYYRKEDTTNNEFFIDKQKSGGGIGVVNLSENNFYYHYFNNNNDFLNNFYNTKKSEVELQNVLDFCFTKPTSSNNTEQPLVLQQKNNQVVIKNLETDAEIVADQSFNGNYSIFTTAQSTKAVVFISFKKNLVVFKYYNKNLEYQNSEQTNYNFNYKIKKIGAFASSSSSFVFETCLLMLTHSNELYILFASMGTGAISFGKINRIGKAQNFYFESSSWQNLTIFMGNQTSTLKTTYIKRNIGYRKLHSKTMLNAKLGFKLNQNQSVYYFLNLFKAIE